MDGKLLDIYEVQSLINEPTGDECSSNKIIYESNAEILWATFHYPQMGGYAGKAIVHAKKVKDECFEVYIWHDGEFPFANKQPIKLHHCSAEQFILFGRHVYKMQRRQGSNIPDTTKTILILNKIVTLVTKLTTKERFELEKILKKKREEE